MFTCLFLQTRILSNPEAVEELTAIKCTPGFDGTGGSIESSSCVHAS